MVEAGTGAEGPVSLQCWIREFGETGCIGYVILWVLRLWFVHPAPLF